MERNEYGEEEYYCLECGEAMGPTNPRQLCGKWRCRNTPLSAFVPPSLPPPPTSKHSVDTPTDPSHPPTPLRRRLLVPRPLSPPIPEGNTPVNNPSPPPMRGRRHYRMKSRCLCFTP